MTSSRRPVIAIAHDYLTQRGGAERVVLAMHRAFPDAKIYTTLYEPDSTFPEFRDAEIITSPLNRVGPLRRDHRLALPLLPFASSMLRVPADIVLASSTGWAHAFPTTGARLVYCHSPARYIYLRDEYLGGPWWKSPSGIALTIIRPALGAWDRRAARRAGPYLANSTVVRDRIRRVYGVDAPVLFPPFGVDTEGQLEPIEGLAEFVGDGGHHLLVSRLLPYKNIDVAVEAFRGLDERLLVIGSGPLAESLRATAPENVRFASNITDAQLRWAYATSVALVAPSFEDFGLTPIEAGTWGKPVFALRGGGYLDTVREGVTGRFFDVPSAKAIRDAVRAGIREFDPVRIRKHADAFGEQRFADELRARIGSMVCIPRSDLDAMRTGDRKN